MATFYRPSSGGLSRVTGRASPAKLFLLGIILFIGSGCGLLRSLLEGFGPGFFTQADGPRTAGVVQLHLVNKSGFSADVEAEYRIDESQVRMTHRVLPADGPEAEADVLATTTKLLRIIAKVMESPDPTSAPSTSQPATSQPTSQPILLKPGDVLLDLELEWKVDFRDGERLVIVIPPPGPPPANFIDCNSNGLSDADDIATGVSHDCNCNNIPDECDLAAGVLHDVNPQDGIADECIHCPPVEVVFIMDTSGSMDDEAAQLCAQIGDITTQLQSRGVTVHASILGITETPEGPFSCLTNSVVSLLGTEVPGAPVCCSNVAENEDWGPAVAVVAARFPWMTGALRVIVPISDEGPFDGDPCENPGNDHDSITAAITAAVASHSIVSPIMAGGATVCTRALGMELADGTGGQVFTSNDPASDLAAAIRTSLFSVCSSQSLCPN